MFYEAIQQNVSTYFGSGQGPFRLLQKCIYAYILYICTHTHTSTCALYLHTHTNALVSFCLLNRNKCVNCQIQFGEYHCNICNLWMSSEDQPYHCEHCGFCRVGGAENFQHCHECGMCIDVNLYQDHHCNRSKYQANCPVCQEYLFSSRSASHEMPCGHAIHWECFQQFSKHDSRCPICKKTSETYERMKPTWDNLAMNIAAQPVPPELSRVVNILCNDCEATMDGLAWHFLGVQCTRCESFNTTIERTVLQGEEAHEFLHAQSVRQMATAAASEDGGMMDVAMTDVSSRPVRRRVNRRRSAF